MIKVEFFNLIRSKYNVKEDTVNAGSVEFIIKQILEKHPEMKESDFKTCVVFYKEKPIHHHSFDKEIPDGETIKITHFVGGG